MPIDPSVLLYGLQPQARTPYDAPDVVAERRARVEQLREQQQQKQQKEYEAKVYDWAIKSNLGPDGSPDIPAVTKALYGVSATLGDNFVTAVTKARKATADTYDLEDKHRTNQVTLLGQSAGDTDETNYGDRYQSWKAIGLQPEQFGLGPTWTPETPMRLKAVGDAATTLPEQHKAKQDAIDHFVKGDFLQGAAQYVQARGANLTDGDVVDLTKRMTQFGAHPEEVRTVMDQTPQELQAWAPGVIEGPAKVAELAGQAESRAETKRQNDLVEAARQRADADRKAAAEAKAVMDADLLRHRRVMETKPAGGAGAGTPAGASLQEEALNQAADKYFATGTLPPLGMGNQAAANRTAIMNRAGERHAGGNLAVNSAEYTANKATLTRLTQQLNAVQAFENTGLKNLDQFTTLAAKIPDTGIPWLNTPVRALAQSVVGSENMAAANAARQVALTEISRVVNNPSLVGVLSDSARSEVLGLSPQNATFKQIKRVAGVLQTDMRNRRTSLADQVADITRRLGGTAKDSTDKPAYHYDPATKSFVKGGT